MKLKLSLDASHLQNAELVVVCTQQPHQAALEVAKLLVREIGQQPLAKIHQGDESGHILDRVLHEKHEETLYLDGTWVLDSCNSLQSGGSWIGRMTSAGPARV